MVTVKINNERSLQYEIIKSPSSELLKNLSFRNLENVLNCEKVENSTKCSSLVDFLEGRERERWK